MKFALIPPFARLSDTKKTDYQLMLPHLVSNWDYSLTYKGLCQDYEQYVILDNGAAEGNEWDIERLHELGEQFQVNEIVIPDELKGMESTLERLDHALDYLRVKYERPQDSPFHYMVVIQGKHWDQLTAFVRLALDMDKEGFIGVWGLPRHLLYTVDDTAVRLKLAEYLFGRPVHFLGANTRWIREGQYASRLPNVRGMDTSAPYVYGLANTPLRSDRQFGRTRDYFESKGISAAQNNQINFNVRDYLSWGNTDVRSQASRRRV